MSYVKKIMYGEPAEKDFNIRTAMEEATRCLLCEDAPCSKGCPAGTNPGKFIRSIRMRNFKGAAETIRENNILGGTCALVCPYGNLCEKECARCGIDEPIKIGKLQKFAIEQEKLFNMQTLLAVMPSHLPSKPSCSVVVALTEMLKVLVCKSCAIFSRIVSMKSLSFGFWQEIVESIFPISYPISSMISKTFSAVDSPIIMLYFVWTKS